MKTFFRTLLALALLLAPTASAWAVQSLTFGVLAFRPAEQVEARWQPLADYLSEQLPEVRVRFKFFDYPGLDEAVRQGQIDLVFTNPAHYVLIAHREELSSPLVGQINLVEGTPVTGFAGVILVRAEDESPRSLADLRGKRIAVPSKLSLGGYQMQAHSLVQAGLRMPEQVRIIETGMPHDLAVEVLIERRADAAFVRSGLYEALLREGRVKPGSLRVLNRQDLPDFPHQVSTPLYPEWPVAALPHVDDALAARFAAALLGLPHGGEIAQALGIQGFTIPYNYEPVRDLLESLRLPPFDASPQFTWYDIREKHGGVLILLAVSATIGTLLLIVLILSRRRMQAAQAALTHSEALLTEAQQTARLGNWELDLRTNRLHWSREIFAIFEIDPTRFSASYEAFLDAIHPEDRELVHQAYTRSLAERRPYEITHRLRMADGRIKHVHERCKSFFAADGTPLLSRGIVQDITEQKLAEQALRASERNYRNLFDNMTVGFAVHEILLDDQGRPQDYRFLQVNPAFEKITGLRSDALIGRRVLEVLPGTEPEWIQIYGEVALTGQPRLFESYSGTLEKYFEVTAYAPQPGQFATLFLDISTRKRQEAELRQAKSAAEAANRAKSRFLATMSHEIRTPLNGILGMAQTLMDADISPSLRLESARTILDSGNILLALLNDILDLSKVEAGRLEIKDLPFRPAQLLEDTAALFAPAAREQGLRLEVSWHGQDSQVFCSDPLRLRQMLSNLISNAVKFTERGVIGVAGRAHPGDDDTFFLRFEVSDTGPGIAEHQRDKLFRPFSQIDDSDTRRHSGSGLGLSIVRSLAALLGGEVGVESSPTRGSTFWFSVRARADEAGDLARMHNPAAPERGEEKQPLRSFDGEKILVVDDNQINHKLLAGMLKKLGLEIIHADDGAQALELIRGGQAPSLVLMDCQMPVMDGLEATARIRAWEQENNRPRLPIIALTAGAFDEDRERCLAAGMDEFLTKPIYYDQLTDALNRQLHEEF
ncbi:PhnD/SsuA/transferrin family substrate-binding protein [Geoalkalibacter halelectricus]|uniref:histidine kinase n=1 Tax=Geoalkalibacter halelectricus TaxID=2847045 RepID=A0ABY5ZKW2_9BACT|nr:PhnD/SsuA/transferrin family substrate-binding protein [Geoalkalibacter halelectricus]MDO3377918.1 PhnD/SsuA/transferrin family substrate-binding protein [Geoalkalibacter halelectricus]UWZ77901.1 PhnD/SsuA/transferrin family substrate-binding protein [Geoalkalibacter halelectricus]